jgi:cyclopropane fatty-acyl-phospholipid synthase-like methyltransferase
MAQLGFYMEAYGPVISAASELALGRKRYGAEVQRNGEALGRHSGVLFHHFYTPIVLEVLREHQARVVLDLGCGAGRSLVDACLRNPSLRGIGLDLSEGAISAARELAAENGLSDRLTFVVGNAFEPKSWPKICSEADVIMAVGVLHEHFRDGEAAVIRLLDVFAELLHQRVKGLLVGEPELYYDRKQHDPDFYLAHILTAQGFPRARTQWLELFDKTRLRCRRVLVRPQAGQRLAFYDLEVRR